MPTITKKQYNEYMRLCQQRDEGKLLTPDGLHSWDRGRFETTDKVTIRIIQKIFALISSLFPAINHVIIRILAFFRTCVFLESDFNDFISGFGRFFVPSFFDKTRRLPL